MGPRKERTENEGGMCSVPIDELDWTRPSAGGTGEGRYQGLESRRLVWTWEGRRSGKIARKKGLKGIAAKGGKLKIQLSRHLQTASKRKIGKRQKKRKGNKEDRIRINCKKMAGGELQHGGWRNSLKRKKQLRRIKCQELGEGSS